jgi:hypothetical protein
MHDKKLCGQGMYPAWGHKKHLQFLTEKQVNRPLGRQARWEDYIKINYGKIDSV